MVTGWIGVGWASMPLVFALLLAAPTVALPEADLGIRRFRTPALAPNLQLSQTFRMPVDGLYAIEVFPAAVSGPSSGHVRFALYDVQEAGTDYRATRVRAVEVPVGQLRSTSPYRVEFASIPDSERRTYRLDLGADAASGVAFWATRGQGYDGGTMLANGRTRWADLAFETYAPAPSAWRLLMTLRERSAWRAYLVLAALAAIWLLVGRVIRTLPAVPREAEAA